MRNQQAAVCRTTAVAAVTEKMVSLPTFIKMEIVNGGLTTDWTLALLEYLGGAGQLWHRDVTRQCTLRTYLWEGFWNGFLLAQTCEIPATARETVLDHLYA